MSKCSSTFPSELSLQLLVMLPNGRSSALSHDNLSCLHNWFTSRPRLQHKVPLAAPCSRRARRSSLHLCVLSCVSPARDSSVGVTPFASLSLFFGQVPLWEAAGRPLQTAQPVACPRSRAGHFAFHLCPSSRGSRLMVVAHLAGTGHGGKQPLTSEGTLCLAP